MLKSDEYFQTDDMVKRHEAKEAAPLITNELLGNVSKRLDNIEERLDKSDAESERRYKVERIYQIIAIVIGLIAALTSSINAIAYILSLFP